MRGCHLHHTSPKLRIGEFVQHDRYLAIHERQSYRSAVKVTVALIRWIDRDAGVAKHGFWPGRGYDQLFVASGNRISNVPEMARRLLVHGFEIGDRGLAPRAPVDHVLATVDEVLFPEPDEDFANGF